MCGIAGFNWSEQSVVEQMLETMRHRGPDDRGFYGNSTVSLGHLRLSILDLSPRGHQPMHFENLVIVYNGEVYNFKELRAELEGFGYKFCTGTDTEVILSSYHKWGTKCVEKFNGMWAFCIYDRDRQLLFLSRDRFGVKPLYYYFDGQRFIFASELKAIAKHNIPRRISNSAVNFFFYQKYIGTDLTIYENCRKLRPGENLIFDLASKKISLAKHYDLEGEIARCGAIPLKERLEAVEATLVDAVQKRLIADVPVGSFLSGGVDSSLISAIISTNHSNFDTFSIGFHDESYNELDYSQIVARHIRTAHHYEYMDIDQPLIEYIVQMMDEPFGDSSILPTYLLSKITRKKVTVSLSGDGGDEVFGGYDTYRGYKLAAIMPSFAVGLTRQLVDRLPPSDKKVTLGFKMKRFVRDVGGSPNCRHLDWMGTFTDSARRELLGENFISSEEIIPCNNNDTLLAVQLNDIHNYLPEDILKKVDMASMLVSLEARVPYLDYRLVPLVLSLPDEYKTGILRTKRLLKKIASKYLPGSIVHRPKRGFTVPVSRWIRQSELIKEFLTGSSYYKDGAVSFEYARRLFDEHISGRRDNGRELWLVFVYNCWKHKTQ